MTAPGSGADPWGSTLPPTPTIPQPGLPAAPRTATAAGARAGGGGGSGAGTGGAAAAIAALYRLLVRQQLTKGRVLLAGVLGGLAVLIAILVNRDTGGDPRDMVEFLSVFGLALNVPIVSLVLASSSLGQLVEDEILVYLWIRPIPRWVLALAAWLAAATVAIPLTAVPLAVSAAIGSGGDMTATWAVALSMALAAAAYTSIFTLIGLVVRRSLIWGLVYLFIWELFVARVGAGAARLSINTYPAAVLSQMTDVTLPLADHSMTIGVVVPLVVSVVGVVLTAWRLDNTNVA